MKLVFTFFISIIFYFSTSGQGIINNIEIQGLKKTKPSFINRFVKLKENDIFNSKIIESDVQRLRNLNLFKDINYRIEKNTDGTLTLIYTIKEIPTLLPQIYGGSTLSNVWFHLGISDFNFRGEGEYIHFGYTYYNRHGFEVQYRKPYFGSSKWGLGIEFKKSSTNEPLYFPNNQQAIYYSDLLLLKVSGNYEISFKNNIGFTIGGLYEKYRAINIEDVPTGERTNAELGKFLSNIYYNIENIDYHFQYRNGIKYNAVVEYIFTPGENDHFVKLEQIFTAYKRHLNRGNLAFRFKVAMGPNKITPNQVFVLDNYTNVRGIGDRVMRGSWEFSSNLEYRLTFYENRYFSTQANTFIDIGLLREGGKEISTMLDNPAIYGGLGFRIYSPMVLNLILRVDYGLDLSSRSKGGFVFGIGQYF